MIKPRLIWFPDAQGPMSSIKPKFNRAFWSKYFDLEAYDPGITYPKTGTVFVSGVLQDSIQTIKELKEDGYHVAIDNLWEIPKEQITGTDYSPISHVNLPLEDFVVLEYREFFWHNEYLYNCYYNLRRPMAPSLEKLALMPMRKQHLHRKLMRSLAEKWIPELMWSMVAQGVFLPGDADHQAVYSRKFNDRHVNWDWYNHTFCSLVSETHQRQGPWLTEKTFKPLAFSHPFLIQASVGTLEYIKSLGFATFDNIFDESYDQETDLTQRTKMILSNLDRIDLSTGYDRETLSRIAHNHALFWDQHSASDKFIKQVIEPLLEYATS